MQDFLSTLTLLGDHQHLRREKAIDKITRLLQEEAQDE
jgi:hypothetical protein